MSAQVPARPIPYGRQTIEDDDVEAVARVLRSDFLTQGPEVEAFEAELAQACGARFAVAVANGTAALHAAYAAAGIGPGDEVVTTPLTFSGTSNMLLALGARPVFADIEADTLCLDPEKAEAAITPRTRAIAAVDFAGQPAALSELREITRRRGLLLVEDAAHSIGGRLHDVPVGALADLTTFSFHPVKTITTGEGGAVLTDDPGLAERARDFRNHGILREPARLTRRDGPWFYEIESLGMNYRLTAIQSALGRSQLAKLPRFVARRTALVARYMEELGNEPGLELPVVRAGAQTAWHLFAVRVRAAAPGRGAATRAAFFAALQQRGIAPQVHYVAVNDFALYRGLGYDPAATPIALDASERLVSLPLYPTLSDEEQGRVIAAIKDALRSLGTLD